MIERLLIHFGFAFVATICFAILLNVPRHAFLAGGLIGGTTWDLYVVIYYHLHVGLALSNLVAAILIGILSMVAAKLQRQPMILYNVPALVPFVPGGQAYKVVRYFVLGNYGVSLGYLYQVIVIAGAITLGFGLGDLINTAIYGRHHWHAAPFSQLKGWKKRD
ncbi:MAG: threonine/serine exporter family protein [Limosilactobacillus gorillae]|jgi:uncharacterized membrane protein YjjB (DUF3815 family)|uniref:threonine/serine exporter family protein n=1 Tax=Limosilactobacillus gorillae TaxID=1450649 RepID=UPI000A5D6C75|nr:threonine/serine exporter family protein [Limosilactobacillus gorillae]MDO4855139.1 threonine/serine exporter family protein [Limosilactobacillus gorillae]